MPNVEAIGSFLGQMIAFGGGGAVIAYLLFQHLGKKWIENKFAERLNLLRHQHALELQRLRLEIDALLSGAIKLQEKEFAVLPEAWAKLDEAHGLVAWVVSPMQQYADVQRMSTAQLEEFLAGTEFTASQKDEVRMSREKSKTYQEIVFWYRLQKVRAAFGELQTYVARNGIFLPPGLKEKFTKIAEMLWSAIVSKEVGHEARDWKMQNEGWQKIKDETEPLYKSIEADIQARLQSHGRKPNLGGP
jgi:hypothetical protein